MASFKSTTTAAFNAVSTSLDSAVKVVNTFTIGVDMLHEYAQAELADQKRSYKLNEATRIAEQVIEAKERITSLQVRAANFISKSDLHAQAYESASTYIDAIVAQMGYENLPTITIAKN